MKHFAIIQPDRTILVKTPNPYVVDTYKDASAEKLEDIRYKLSEHTKFLYDCLRVLKISKKEAQEHRYTLNMRTGDALIRLAIHSDFISSETFKTIRDHKW